MRKRIALFLSILLIASLFLSSCGSKDEQKEPAESNQQTSSSTSSTTQTEPAQPDVGASPAAEPEAEPFHIAPASFGDISITPVQSVGNKAADIASIPLDGAFLISPQVETTREELIDSLTLNNNENMTEVFTLEESGGSASNGGGASADSDAASAKSYRLIPSQPLKGGTVYTLRYESQGKNPLSFAFQTEADFQVESTLPGAGSYSVPADTGIEITFNAELEDGLDLKDYFSIKPSVSGRWEDRVANTYTFVPSALQYSTAYTVTVKGGENGVRDAQGRVLAEDYKFTFNTEWTDESSVYLNVFGNEYETFLPGDDVFVELSISHEFAGAEFSADVYQFNSPDDFISGETETAELIETFNASLSVTDTGYQKRYYLPAGKTYGEGYYLFEIKTAQGGQEYTCRKWIQVSSLSVYSLALGGKMAVWVNDTTTGGSAENISVRMEGQQEYFTNQEGVAIIPAPENGDATVLISKPDSQAPAHIFSLQTYEEKELTTEQKYFHYLYTDRAVYFPDDTIRVFGVINARYEEDLLTGSDSLTLKLGDMAETTVKPDKYGAFEASFDVEDMYGGIGISLALNGEVIQERSVSFAEYEREMYNFTAGTDRKVYFAGETVTLNASVSTLDGSPVEGMTVASSYPEEFDAVTDANGNASASYGASSYGYNTPYSWQPETSSGWITLLGRDDNNQDTNVSTVTLPSTVMLEYERESCDPGASVEFTSSMIDRDALEEHFKNSTEDYYNTYDLEDIYRGEAHDMTFTLTITEARTVQTNKREYYNFVQKKNVVTYDYDTEEETYSVSEITTQGGKATVTGVPVSDDPMVYYYGTATYTDTNGTDIEFSVDFGAQPYIYRGEDKMYAVKMSARPETPDGEIYYSLRLNETGIVSLYDVYAPETDVISEGTMLLVPATDVITEAYTGSPDGTEFTFTENYINSASMFGAYFDGKHVYPTQYPISISYDTEEVTLDIDLTFDKESYKPGDTVNAEVTVTDAEGKPVQARTAISVVDEAVLKANPNEARFLAEYYETMNLDPNPFSYYASYTPHDGYVNYGGAEMGDGGGMYVLRQDFNDNPAFFLAETGADGKDSVSFKLSDAVTSWRVTALAITEDDKIGDAKENVFAGLPFYIDLVMLKTFITGDELAVYAKPYGEEYEFNRTRVKYTAELVSGGEVIKTLTDESDLAVTLNFGVQPAGEYAVRVYAEAGGFTDAMEESVTVAETDINLPLFERHVIDGANPALATGYDITGQPVSVVFTNGDAEPLLNILHSTLDYQSDRTDYLAADAFARSFWNGEREINGEIDPKLASALQNAGGVAELTYGEPDLLYTARFAAAFPELVNKESIADYTNNYMTDENGMPVLRSEPGDANFELERAKAYFALAAVKESVLPDLRYQASLLEAGDSYEGILRRLLYAAAFAAIGDDGSAKALMDMGKDGPRVFTEASQSEILSAISVYVNTAVDPPAAFEVLKASTELPGDTQATTANTYVSGVCEKINFLKKAVPVSGVVSEVSYTLDGREKTARLSNFECLSLSIPTEQYEALNVKQVSGRTNVDVSFAGSPDNLDEALNSIEITKEITQTNAAGSGDVYIISLTVEDSAAIDKDFSCVVYDRVPSNMRAFGTESEGQRVTLWIDNYDNPGDELKGKLTASYYAERVSDAEAAVPKAYASRLFDLDEAWGATE